jgi:hypothetical protein
VTAFLRFLKFLKIQCFKNFLFWNRYYNGAAAKLDVAQRIRVDKKGVFMWVAQPLIAGPYNKEHSLAIAKNGSAVISSSISTFGGNEITRYNEFGQTEWVRT